jgi:hypothetical protein
MTRYETAAFDPSISFSWTLRSGEIARRRQRRPLADAELFADATRAVTQVQRHSAGYEAPAFAPGIAFAWTLRSAEIARRHSRQPLAPVADVTGLNVLVAA